MHGDNPLSVLSSHFSAVTLSEALLDSRASGFGAAGRESNGPYSQE